MLVPICFAYFIPVICTSEFQVKFKILFIHYQIGHGLGKVCELLNTGMCTYNQGSSCSRHFFTFDMATGKFFEALLSRMYDFCEGQLLNQKRREFQIYSDSIVEQRAFEFAAKRVLIG